MTNRFVDRELWQGEDLLKVFGLLEQLRDPKLERDMSWRRSVAGLFNACLAVNVKLCTGSVEANTELLALMYGRADSSLYGVHLIGTFDEGRKIRFDFSGRIINDSYLDGYHDFWECSFDAGSKFVQSTIVRIRKRDKSALPISIKQFENCILDTSIQDAFRVAQFGELQTDEQIGEFILDFLRMFRSYGRFQPQTIDRPHKGRGGFNSLRKSFAGFRFKTVDFETMLNVFVDAGLVERVRMFGEDKAQVHREHFADIERYVSNRTHSAIIKAVHEAIKHRKN